MARLAISAEGRLLFGYAIPLYRRSADAGDRDAARQLANLLARRGDLFGVTAAHAPVWHLRKLPGGELASLYVDSFERAWETATP